MKTMKDEMIREFANSLANSEDGFYAFDCVEGTMPVYKMGAWYYGIYQGRYIPYTSATMIVTDIIGTLGGIKLLRATEEPK